MKEDKGTMEPDATDKVDIIFGVDLPEPVTKAMADDPQVQNLRVAVFGGSGYLKEYVQAEPIDLATKNTTRYNYKVRLSLSDSYLKVHFIANGPATLPFKYEDEVMSVETVSGNQDAYWQRIELPNGITAKRDADGVVIKTDAGEYIVSDETKAHFQDIPLIRNFAKIVVKSTTSDFTLKSYAIVNKPSMGSIAAYNKKTNSFVMNYQDSTMADLKEWYPGNIPAAATIDKTIPAASAFSANPVYMYERPIPTEDATFLIVFGTYDGVDYYYRIELQDANGYYAIYRNWVYTINIKGILKPGSATPTDAANSSGSGDVSTDQKAENLTDVSDGIARIYVQYTDTTIVGNAVPVTLKYMFLPNASSTATANGAVTGGVGVEIAKHQVGATGAVIDGDITRATDDDGQGWRTLSFTTTNAGEVTKTESIKITGHYMNGSVPSKLFRIVTFHLMSLQTMQVICDPHDLLKGKGEEVDVLIKIPKDLPRSLFPLQLKIESSANSITPNNDNLPVSPGKSIINNTTATYQFIKTVDYDDYLALQEASTDDWVTVTTHFKTTKESSDCDVYVANQYFNTAHDSFTTYTMKNFSNLSFDNNAQMNPDMPVNFSFTMVSTDIPEKVTLKLNGLKPATGSTLVQIGTNTYEYYTNNSNLANISLLTSSDEGVYGAEISASHYYDASIGNLSYNNPRFTSTAAAGRNKPINFAFSYVNDIIEPVTFTLTNIKPLSTDTRFNDLGGGQWRFTPIDTNLDQTITFQTESWDNVSLTMSGASYNSSSANSTAATTMTIEANSLNFKRNGNNEGGTKSMYYNSSSSINVTNDGSYYNYQFTITRSSLNANLTVYFRRNDNNRYSTAISVYELDEATTGNVLTIDLSNGSAPAL